MGFVSFLGRVLFASLFILAAWKMYNEFGTDGGPAAKELAMKFAVLQKNLSSKLGVRVPDVDVRHLVAINIVMKVIGGVMFVFYSSYAAFLMSMALCGALLFFLGMKNSILKRQRKKKATKTKTV
ncbi:hypothetical protein I3760_02G114600 [Carya illinoinensis]|nr:hypothetical protein I3760_02G114600 [Carya illinoinensis]